MDAGTKERSTIVHIRLTEGNNNMKPGRLQALRLLLASLAAGLLVAAPVQATEIKIGGTGNALGAMRLLGEAYSRQHPGVKVNVLNSIGSSGALLAIPKGAIDIGLISRAPTDEERAKGIVATEYARTLTVLAVSTKSKVTAITRAQIADLYAGRLVQWPDGTAIRPVLRQPGDDNTRQLRALSPEIESALAIADKRPGMAFAVIDQEAADKMESIPGAIGVTTLGLILSEKRQLRALTLDGVEPVVRNGVNGSYPIVKQFYMLTSPAPSETVQQFMAFVRSPAGRDILAKTGHWMP